MALKDLLHSLDEISPAGQGIVMGATIGFCVFLYFLIVWLFEDEPDDFNRSKNKKA